MLRGQRKIWDMNFAGGGAEALEILAERPFDVIVTDMRMPGIDGAELLSRVSQEYPNIVRLVLSGQSDQEKIFRTVGPAHQFLSKPCDPDHLIDTIQRTCNLHKRMDDESLVRLTSSLKSLPSLPNVYRELLKELEMEDVSLDSVGTKIGSDIAMSAKVLQLVNSSFFGLPHHISSPRHAVSLLGINTLRPLVLSANAFSQFEDPKIPGFSLDKLIVHSLAVATWARRIADAENASEQVVDQAFMAGMLHDIGKLILAVNLPRDYAQVLELAEAGDLPISKCEKVVFGTSHAEVGAHLLGLWGLPDSIVEAVAFHHQPAASASDEFSALTAVYAANTLQNAFDFGNYEQELDSLWDLNYLHRVGMRNRLGNWESLSTFEQVAQ